MDDADRAHELDEPCWDGGDGEGDEGKGDCGGAQPVPAVGGEADGPVGDDVEGELQGKGGGEEGAEPVVRSAEGRNGTVGGDEPLGELGCVDAGPEILERKFRLCTTYYIQKRGSYRQRQNDEDILKV